jgi:glycosyltransferase involved in cell wall biosynthesis
MDKPLFVISSPFDSYSGYGARSRDLIKAIIDLDKYDVKLVPQRWGGTAWGFCKNNPNWEFLWGHKMTPEFENTQPDIWMQITIPSEFNPIGKYNIGVTAGIEATVCRVEWVDGLNKMDMNWVSSKFSKDVFENVVYDRKNNGIVEGRIAVNKPIHVIFEGADLNVYKPLKSIEIKNINFSTIPEQFNFLFVGHWMNGNLGNDRKNLGLLIFEFFQTFKNTKNKPALILKATTGVSSYISRNEILDRINSIRKLIDSKDLPNIYLINGDLDDSEMNELYNHPKVKCMISLTKGEGFGRPLLEFSLTQKPIIASGWSGHLDFLKPEFTMLLQGVLEPVHESAANDWLIKEAMWFKPTQQKISTSMKDMVKNYKKVLEMSKRQSHFSKSNFSWENMKDLIGKTLDENVKEFPKQVELVLPKLIKLE